MAGMEDIFDHGEGSFSGRSFYGWFFCLRIFLPEWLFLCPRTFRSIVAL